MRDLPGQRSPYTADSTPISDDGVVRVPVVVTSRPPRWVRGGAPGAREKLRSRGQIWHTPRSKSQILPTSRLSPPLSPGWQSGSPHRHESLQSVHRYRCDSLDPRMYSCTYTTRVCARAQLHHTGWAGGVGCVSTCIGSELQLPDAGGGRAGVTAKGPHTLITADPALIVTRSRRPSAYARKRRAITWHNCILLPPGDKLLFSRAKSSALPVPQFLAGSALLHTVGAAWTPPAHVCDLLPSAESFECSFVSQVFR